jgi:molybdate transport system substrate-binding protein
MKRLLTLALVALAAPVAAEEGAPQVFAAASLAEAFRALGRPAEFQLAASSTLVVQIEQGAPADVVATADEPTMQRLVAGQLALEPRLFARNSLEIAVEAGNPKGIQGLADLARPDLLVVLAAPEVPAGRYAREALAAAGVQVKPRSLEENVKAVLTKVLLGEADAGIVYRTDVLAAGPKVTGVAIPASAPQATYWIAVLRGARRPEAARAFAAHVLSPEGRAVFARFGFASP